MKEEIRQLLEVHSLISMIAVMTISQHCLHCKSRYAGYKMKTSIALIMYTNLNKMT